MVKRTKQSNLVLTEARDAFVKVKKERSPKWPKVESKHRKKHPVCECCGTNKELNVHHKKPFHLFPELELDENNLITLCMEDSKLCHLKIGHGGDFKKYNPNVDQDVKMIRENQMLFEETAKTAKKNALKG